jgi:hypothetical protein
VNELDDARALTGVERRLGAVEALIPEAPLWRPAPDTETGGRGDVRFGRAFGRRDLGARHTRSRLVLAMALVLLLVALLVAAILGVGRPPVVDLSASPYGPYGLYRGSDASANAAALPDGRVLIVSGAWQGMGIAVARADIWDPEFGTVPADPTLTARINPTVTLLLDGGVLVIGGFGGPFQYPSTALASAELWDPVTGEFRYAASMAEARVGHTATLLPDGRVLVIGGTGPRGVIAAAELWDPETRRFTEAGSLTLGRSGHASVLVTGGQVLIAGGRDAEGAGVGLVEIWEPSTNRFIGQNRYVDNPPDVTATRLLDGRVLIAGAFIVPEGFRGVSVKSYPSGGPGFSFELSQPREGHAATLLADGGVLITGGGPAGTGEGLPSAELWEVGTGSFRDVPPMLRAAARHATFLLPDGRVLVVLDGSGPDGFVDPFLFDPTVEPPESSGRTP